MVLSRVLIDKLITKGLKPRVRGKFSFFQFCYVLLDCTSWLKSKRKDLLFSIFSLSSMVVDGGNKRFTGNCSVFLLPLLKYVYLLGKLN